MFWLMFFVSYAAIAGVAMYMTWHEHTVKEYKKSLFRALLGLVACAFWPATLVAVGLSAMRRAH